MTFEITAITFYGEISERAFVLASNNYERYSSTVVLEWKDNVPLDAVQDS